MVKKGARRTALMILHDLELRGTYVDLALKNFLQREGLSLRDRSLVTELCYGVVRYILLLDWWIEKVSERKADDIDPWVRNILRITLYQISFLDKIPVPAACHEGVELAKEFSHKGGVKFVNGVLRGYLRKKDRLSLPDSEKFPYSYLSLKYSFPLWMVKRWILGFGTKQAEEYMASLNFPAPLTFRVNTLKTNRQGLREALQREGVIAEESLLLSEALVLKKSKDLSALDSYQKGLFQVQSESSMLASLLVDPIPGETLLDSCSAPGGKSTHLAQLMKDRGKIISCDIHSHKIKLIEKNANRLGVSIIEPLLQGAQKLPARLTGKIDRALVDAPCSGLGVIRRKPDLKWKRKPSDFASLAELQLKLLEEAARVLKPSGVLVYSVCTNEPEETYQVAEKFTAQNTNFSPTDLTPLLPERLKGEGSARKGILQLYPHRHHLDGFFLARWQKL